MQGTSNLMAASEMSRDFVLGGAASPPVGVRRLHFDALVLAEVRALTRVPCTLALTRSLKWRPPSTQVRYEDSPLPWPSPSLKWRPRPQPKLGRVVDHLQSARRDEDGRQVCHRDWSDRQHERRLT